jgi:hypothetical protein
VWDGKLHNCYGHTTFIVNDKFPQTSTRHVLYNVSPVSHRSIIVVYVVQIGIEEETTEKGKLLCLAYNPTETNIATFTSKSLFIYIYIYISITRKASSHKLD